MTQILVIIAIALAIFMLPRLAGKRVEKNGSTFSSFSEISGWLRLAIMASILWPAGAAIYLKPWNDHWPMFLFVGIGPVILFWGIFWVLSGFRK
jgi:hypothetical protein